MRKYLKRFYEWCCDYIPFVLCLLIGLLVIGCMVLPLFIVMAKYFWQMALI